VRVAKNYSHLTFFDDNYFCCNTEILGQFEPGMYAIEVLGELPEDAIEHCENFELEYRAKAKQNK
jgi:hypothetical protein